MHNGSKSLAIASCRIYELHGHLSNSWLQIWDALLFRSLQVKADIDELAAHLPELCSMDEKPFRSGFWLVGLEIRGSDGGRSEFRDNKYVYERSSGAEISKPSCG